MARQNARFEVEIRDRWTRLSPTLDERGRRLFVGNEAATVGYGGVTALHRATGVAESTIRRGVRALVDLERPAGRLATALTRGRTEAPDREANWFIRVVGRLD
ncbi:MAG: hypothetical protein ACI9VR_003520 [Cognaticolwellia sp.]|jgi:hypothetical protein